MSESDVKKINDELSNELQQKHDLKHIETKEKIVLPSKEDLQAEKIYENDEEVKKQLENPELKEKLHHVETVEKNVLPSKEQIEKEKEEQQKEAQN